MIADQSTSRNTAEQTVGSTGVAVSLPTRTPIAMIAAMSQNRVIGVDGDLPWHLPDDLRFFKRMTRGKPVIMGRRTFDSIGRALPERLNIVVTRDAELAPPDVVVCHSLERALALADDRAVEDGAEEIMVMGGGEIYAQAMPCARRLYITEVATRVQGDAVFPEIDSAQWDETGREAGTRAQGQPAYEFVIYQRRSDPAGIVNPGQSIT
ncbi:dihydrofolate reductase [Vreelandella jeotgali]|uniref:dihydrofolate reductase n=1 Tax=Vreelandella jeotgali TaxID=553386 RepID=UPI000362B666